LPTPRDKTVGVKFNGQLAAPKEKEGDKLSFPRSVGELTMLPNEENTHRVLCKKNRCQTSEPEAHRKPILANYPAILSVGGKTVTVSEGRKKDQRKKPDFYPQ